MLACPACGHANPDEARFCMACANPLVGAEPAEQGRESRKTVTVVFTDVTGSTTLGERLDPESLRRVMGRFFEETSRVLIRHGGSVEKFIGDAVVAMFGVPTLHEDDALRAVRAALEMRGAVRELNVELDRDWGVTLRTRTGVNTGEVVAPATRREGEHFVIGDAVNVAARLEQTAEPDEIVVGDRTYRLVRDAVVAERLEPRELKGKSGSVAAWRLLDVKAVSEGHDVRLDSPMVGRHRQLGMMLDAFRATASDRTCHLFTVLGSPGVGKSRLIREFLTGIGSEAETLMGRCLSYGEGITFWPVVEMLKAAAAIGDDVESTGEQVAERLAVRLGDTPDATEVATRLSDLLGIGPPPSNPEETFWSVRRLFEAIGRTQPVVAVFEDIHWAEPTLLDLVEHISDWSSDSAILLVCTGRPELLEHRPGWGGGKFNATSILLEPLTSDDAGHLVANLLAGGEVPAEVRQRIVQAAEGTPLFVEEMVAMLVDDGLLRRSNSHWDVTGDLNLADIPPTIDALLSARLDRLRPDERLVVESAAVEGRTFHREAVTELTPAPARLDLSSHLMNLGRRGLIRPDASDSGPPGAYSFRHQLIRDAAYRAIPKARRADLHRAFADWLEGSAGSMLQEYDEILGYHLEQAFRYRTELGTPRPEDRELADRAAGLLGAAGMRAHARGDLPAAVNLLSRALELPAERSSERSGWSIALADALFGLGEYGRCEQTLREALDEAERTGDEVLQMRVRAELLNARGAWDPEDFVKQADELSREATALFETAGDDLGLSRAWTLAASGLQMLGHADGHAEALEHALEYACRAGATSTQMRAVSELAAAMYWGATPADQGTVLIERLLEERSADRVTRAYVRRCLAGFRGMQGRFDDARRLLAESMSTFEELGMRHASMTESFFAGPMELWAGRPEAAEASLRKDCDALQAIGDRAYLCSLASFLADALYALGRDDEAWSYTDLAERTAGREDTQAHSDLRSVRAKLLARRGDIEAAEALAREAIDLIERTGESNHKGDAWFDLAEVLRMGSRDEDADDALVRARDWYRSKGNAVMTAKVDGLLSQARR